MKSAASDNSTALFRLLRGMTGKSSASISEPTMTTGQALRAASTVRDASDVDIPLPVSVPLLRSIHASTCVAYEERDFVVIEQCAASLDFSTILELPNIA
jgi:hypothetical protein